VSYLSKEDLLAIYGVPVMLYGPDGKLLKAETEADPFSNQYTDNSNIWRSEYMGSFEPKPLEIEDIEAMRDAMREMSMPTWDDRTPRAFAPQEYAGIGTLGLSALVENGWVDYTPCDQRNGIRTRTPEWQASVRERLATGLDDSPVLP